MHSPRMMRNSCSVGETFVDPAHGDRARLAGEGVAIPARPAARRTTGVRSAPSRAKRRACRELPALHHDHDLFVPLDVLEISHHERRVGDEVVDVLGQGGVAFPFPVLT